NGNFGAQCDPLKGVDTTTNDTTGGGMNIDFLNVGFLNIYPNPTSDAFTVSLEMFTAQSVTLEVFSYNGQLVERVEVPQTANVVRTFDLGSAANGIYLVKISTPEGSRLEKVMISK
ncbi:MAG: T9SS type A sorting domain-containing protein, partial [Bacteroidota bacterium]